MSVKSRKNSRAHAVVFGFDFQVNAAIVLFLENINDLKSLRLEGNYEDIELELNNGQYILAQAKSIEKGSSDFRNVRSNLQKALQTLSEGNQKVSAKQLILITNSFNPLNDAASQGIFSGPAAHRKYSSLPESSQKIIDNYLLKISKPFDIDKFWIQTIPFETDDDIERYKNISHAVDDFIGDLSLNIPGIGKKLLTIWHEDIFKNGSKKDAAIKLSKKDLIWPMLAIITGIELCDDKFLEKFDQDIYEEIICRYNDVINSCCERYEFFIKVLYDYNGFKNSNKPAEKCIDFAMNKWKDYVDEFTVDGIDCDTRIALTQIVLYNVVRRCRTINKIKQGVNL